MNPLPEVLCTSVPFTLLHSLGNDLQAEEDEEETSWSIKWLLLFVVDSNGNDLIV